MAERSSKPPLLPRRTKSGESPAVKSFREKLDSIAEGTFPVLEEINRQADALKQTVSPPKESPPVEQTAPSGEGDAEPDPKKEKDPDNE